MSQSSPNMAPKPAAVAVKKSGGGLSLAKPIPGAKPKEKPLSPLEKKEGMASFLELAESQRISSIDFLHQPAEGAALAFAVSDLVAVTIECGLTSIEGVHVIAGMAENINGGASAERGLLLLQSLLSKLGRSMEPFVFPLFMRLLSLHADRSPAVRDLAPIVVGAYGNLLCPHAFRMIFPLLTAGMVDEDWRVKVGTLQLLKAIAPRMSKQLSPLLPQIIPQVSNCIYDSKKQVQTAGLEALNEACRAISNEDIRHLTPQLVSVIARPDESAATLDSLLETTFVATGDYGYERLIVNHFLSLTALTDTVYVFKSTVDSPTLALIAPLLGKALRGRSSVLKRKAARVIDNMCRLVKEPADVAPFMPLLLPALDKVIDEIVDAEVSKEPR
jgi:elongation factor 3